jgi:hypothetical protein
MMLKDPTITVEKLLPEMICRLSARSAVNMPRSRVSNVIYEGVVKRS